MLLQRRSNPAEQLGEDSLSRCSHAKSLVRRVHQDLMKQEYRRPQRLSLRLSERLGCRSLSERLGCRSLSERLGCRSIIHLTSMLIPLSQYSFILLNRLSKVIRCIFFYTASAPACETNLNTIGPLIRESDIIRLRCSVNFSGNVMPAIEWRLSDGHVITDGVDTDAIPSKTIASNLNVVANSSINSKTYRCVVHFNRKSLPFDADRSAAKNVPRYSSTCVSPVINVVCK